MNGPKVGSNCLSKIWLYAGKSEYPKLLEKVKMQGCRQSAGKASRKTDLARSARFVKGHDFSRAVTAAKIDGASAPEV